MLCERRGWRVCVCVGGGGGGGGGRTDVNIVVRSKYIIV